MSSVLSVLPTLPVTSADRVYLRLRLDRSLTAVIPLEHTREVFTVRSQRVAPMPNLPSCVLGLLNQRSRIFWLVDLPAMLNLEPLDPRSQNYMVAIIWFENTPLALAVPEVRGVIRLPASAWQATSSGDPTLRLRTYVRGEVRLSEDERLPVLDAPTLINSPLWNLQ